MRQHRQHGRDVGTDRHEACLGEADLPRQQHHIGGEPEQGVHADDLQEAEVEIHRMRPPPLRFQPDRGP